MKGLILAAGRGSRMGKHTLNRPKCLVEVKGVSLLDRQINSLNQAGIREIAIVTGYRADMLTDKGLVTFENRCWEHSNMVRSLLAASEWLSTSATVVSYSDIFYQASAIESLIGSLHDIAILYDENWLDLWSRRFKNPLSDAESFIIDRDRRVVELGEKGVSLDRIMGQYMGLMKFTAEGWGIIKDELSRTSNKKVDKMFMTDILNCIAKSDSGTIYGVPYSDGWGEVDEEADLLLYNSMEMIAGAFKTSSSLER